MKLMALSIAGVLAASTFAAAPASAQRWHDGRGWHEGRYQYGGRWYAPPRGYYRGGYWDGRRYLRGPRYRTVCRWRPGPYGRVEVCRRVR
ncbi:hypothetical protein [Sphingomonas sp.]|jgi:hypothetical protein|uniref:hypothetical protein n=1 Tax=Sphingomonas sp. TaxID=28214 RepID=UPI0035C7FD5E